MPSSLVPRAARLVRRLRALALPLALAACEVTEPSGDVRQDRIWTGYELEYDADADVTVARATFRIGDKDGTTLRLTEGSEVRFAGQLLLADGDGFGGTRYERTLNGYVQGGTFRWVDADGRALDNHATLRPARFPSPPATIDNDASYAVAFVGPALVEGEEVEVRLLRAGSIGAGASGLQTLAGATQVVVPQSELAGFTPGAVTGELTRSAWIQPAQRTAAGGRIELRYRAPSVGITVVD